MTHRHTTFLITASILVLFYVGILYWGVPAVLDTPAQQTVDLAVADDFAGSRAWVREYTPQQVAFRWIPNEVSLPVPIWASWMRVHTRLWVQPDTTLATVQVGQTQFGLAGTQYQSPRVFQVLLAPQATTTTHLNVKSQDGTPRWAFTTITLHPTTMSQVAPSIWVVWVWIWLVGIGIVIRWRTSSVIFKGIGIAAAVVPALIALWLIHPIGIIATAFIQNPNRHWMIAGIVFITAVIWLIPAFLRWMMQQTSVPRIVISIYVCVTVVPIAFTFFHLEYDPLPVTDNHAPAPFPQWQDVVQYTVDFEAWLMDNVGLRSLMIRTKNEIDYRVFRSSSRVYFGAEHRIFLRRWSDERFPALTRILNTPDQRARLRDDIRTQVDWFTSQGITCYVVIVPSKEIIYPEHVPWYVPRMDYQQQLDFEDELRQDGVPVVPTYAIMRDLKPNVPQLYYPQDFHWNRVAAYHVSMYIADDFARTHPAQALARPQLRYEFQAVPIHDREFAALLTNSLPFVSGIEGIVSAPADITWQASTFDQLKFRHWQNTTAVLWPDQNLHIIGDSFSVRLSDAGFTSMFANVYNSNLPRDNATYARWLRDAQITTVVWQLRDVSLPLYFNNQEEQ